MYQVREFQRSPGPRPGNEARPARSLVLVTVCVGLLFGATELGGTAIAPT